MNRMISTSAYFIVAHLICFAFSYAESAKPDLKSNLPWQTEIAKKSSKSVMDYFLLLPSSILDCENTSQGFPTMEARKKLARTVDAKNGYLEFMKKAQLAIFKDRANKTDIIAIQSGMSGAGASCGAVNSLFSFDSASGSWINRDDLLPPGFKHQDLYNKLADQDILPYFELPRKGLEIKIKDENSDSTLSVVMWTGQKFVVKH